MEPKIPWYQSAIIRHQIVMVIIGVLGLLKVSTDIDVDATVGAVLAGIAALVPVWTIVVRLTKPSPPITQMAADKAEARAVSPSPKEGGYIRGGMLGLILAFSSISGAVLGMQACATLGVPTPHGFNEKLAVGYGTLSSVRNATASVLSAGSITPAEAQGVQDKADHARILLDDASRLKSLDLANAEARLAAAIQILTALDSFLVNRRAGYPAEVPR